MSNNSLSYSSIGAQFTIRVDLSAMSGRDKSALLRQLLEEAGVMAEVAEISKVNPEFAASINVVLGVALNKLWDA